MKTNQQGEKKMTNVSKKVYYLDIKNNELIISFDIHGNEQIKKAKTVKQIVDILNITKGTDEDLKTSYNYLCNSKANKLWNTGYAVWLYSIQIQANGKPLGFYLAFMKYREIYAVA
jgi:hypothetical protein